MAEAAASFNKVMLCTRSILRSLMIAKVLSKPSNINNGWLGFVANSSVNPITLLFPLISISGKRFGSDPNKLLSIIANDGSNVFKLCKTFWLPTICKSLAEYLAEEPVKAFRSR
ncbi:hypothetical protein D3C86_1025730 [compost metagenome]